MSFMLSFFYNNFLHKKQIENTDKKSNNYFYYMAVLNNW